MFGIILGVFIVLHGLVHLLYLGQSQRFFELQPGMVWPDGSWAFSGLLGNGPTRLLASICLAVTAVGFVVAGIGIFLRQAWWQPLVIGASIFSSVLYVLLWDGGWQNLDDKGGAGLLINVALLTAVLVFQWPQFDF